MHLVNGTLWPATITVVARGFATLSGSLTGGVAMWRMWLRLKRTSLVWFAARILSLSSWASCGNGVTGSAALPLLEDRLYGLNGEFLSCSAVAWCTLNGDERS